MTRVLVVDDEPQILRALAANLAREATQSTWQARARRRSPSLSATDPTPSSSISASRAWTGST